MQTLTLPPTHALSGTVELPGSKSISNRALLLASLAQGTTRLHNLLESDDINFMIQALGQLGIPVQPTSAGHSVTGAGGPLINKDIELSLNLGLAGTALRPLTAALTLGRGIFTLDGTQRMRERPIAPLVDGLRQLGADIEYLGSTGYPPVRVTASGLAGGEATMAGDLSSQFLTSVLMTAPLADTPVKVRIEGEQVSKPYLDITLQMMSHFGATIRHDDYQYFEVTPGAYYSPGEYLVEGDASSASYFLAAGAIAGSGVTVQGIGAQSMQGDIAFVEVLRAMGANVVMRETSVTVRPGRLQAVDLDLNAIPDAAMTLAVLALFAEGTTTIRNIYNWRVKETDRLAAMSCELRKLGASVVEGKDFITITAPAQLRGAVIDTYGDHRMAMCFSLVALAGVAITLNDPECVNKTYPEYFEIYRSLAA
jgi:3-phosphoshikimate 1-carboxyvinyltransferase